MLMLTQMLVLVVLFCCPLPLVSSFSFPIAVPCGCDLPCFFFLAFPICEWTCFRLSAIAAPKFGSFSLTCPRFLTTVVVAQHLGTRPSGIMVTMAVGEGWVDGGMGGGWIPFLRDK